MTPPTRPQPPDLGSEYGRLLAERDRLIGEGVDPAELEMPLAPRSQDRPPYERLERYELGPEQRLVTPDPTRLRRGIAAGLVIEVIVIGLAVLGAWLLLSGLRL